MLIHRFRPSQAGVTLVESLIAVSIVAMLLVIGLPAIGPWLKNTQIRTAAESLRDGLAFAQQYAADCNVAVEFVLDAGGVAGWTVQAANPGQLTNCSGTDRFPNWPMMQRSSSNQGASQVVLTSVTDDNTLAATTVTFSPTRQRAATNVDGSPVMGRICVDLPSTVLAPADTRDLELDIELGGEVRMCDPKVSDPNDTRVCRDLASICVGR